MDGLRGPGGVGCLVIVLHVLAVIALRAHFCWGLTEGQVLEEGVMGHLELVSSMSNRTQGTFTCRANDACYLGNLTSTGKMYRCRGCLKIRGRVISPGVLVQGSTVTFNSAARICAYHQGNGTCIQNGTNWSMKVDRDFRIRNGTVITGGHAYLYIFWVLPDTARATQTAVAPLVHTCQQMGQIRVAEYVRWTVKFPPIPPCNRRRRAWYDTVLGGTGTLYGLANTADNEVTRTMLSNTGEYTAQAVTKTARWMPSTVSSQLEGSDVWKSVFKWNLKLWNETYDALHNLSHIGNWTVCSLQTIHAETQRNRFQIQVMSNNYHAWRTLWNISSSLWLQLHAEMTICNKSMCTGYWDQYNMTSVMTVCRYQILPVITTKGFWYLHVSGEWWDVKTNRTYEVKHCDETDKGLACPLVKGHSNPCFTDSRVVLCDWTVTPPEEQFWQVGPNTLCVATMTNSPQVPSVPFSGCLKGIHMWEWNNVTYWLSNYTVSSRLTKIQWEVLHSPWTLSLERFKCALDGSTEVAKLIDSHRSNLSRLMVSTLVAQGEIKHVATLIEQASAHHWWDIFTGMSSTANKVLIPPMIAALIIISILTLCNLIICWYVIRLRREINWVIMQRLR
uniref:Envelope glycoprotein n=1 Tax=Nothobranchius furzeri TaxID=105023 RepID=A0A8C6NST4_NOTFU